MDKNTHIQNIINRTVSLAEITDIEIMSGMARFTFDTRIVTGDYWIVGVQNSDSIETLEAAARNILRTELTVFLR